MKTLLVLRHAKSSWDDPTLDDHARPLNARGRRDAPRMGALLKAEGLRPDLTLSSDALRARTTAETVAIAAGAAPPVLDPRLYLAGPADIVEVLRAAPETVNTLMVVGHNPGLEGLVTRLTGESHDLPTAALVRIALPIRTWRELTTATKGGLVALWRPKELP